MTFQHQNPHLCDDPLWKDSNGKFWTLDELGDDHLKNIQKMLRRMRGQLIDHIRRAQTAFGNVGPCWDSSSRHLKHAARSFSQELQCVDNWLKVTASESIRRRAAAKRERQRELQAQGMSWRESLRAEAAEARETAREISRKARETFPLCEHEWDIGPPSPGKRISPCGSTFVNIHRAYICRLEQVRENAETLKEAWRRGRGPTSPLGRHSHLSTGELHAAADLFESLSAPHVRSTHHKTLRMFGEPQQGRFASVSYIQKLEKVWQEAEALRKTLEGLEIRGLGVPSHTRRALRSLFRSLGNISCEAPPHTELWASDGAKLCKVRNDYLSWLEVVKENARIVKDALEGKVYGTVNLPNDVHAALKELFGSLGVASCEPTRRDHLEKIRKAATELKGAIQANAHRDSLDNQLKGARASRARQELFDLLS